MVTLEFPQLLAIAIIIVAVVFIVVRRATGRADKYKRYSDLIVSTKVPSELSDDMPQEQGCARLQVLAKTAKKIKQHQR